MKKCIAIPILLLSIFLKGQQPTQTTTMDSIHLNEVTLKANAILGSKFEAKNRTGSAFYISPKEIKKFNYTDINRTLRGVPGVNVYEEDGFGLRPNISLRGTSPERSSKITLMEDGVLIAPAPYSAPSAYYFPTIGRMQAVEILKGSSQVQYGPYTTGGALNMISTEVPDSFGIFLNSSFGSFNSGRIHTQVGDTKKNFGYAIEYLNYNSNGFKDLDNGENTGFDKNDLVAKFRVNSNADAKVPQSVELKFQYSNEDSNETYLGLTETDFSLNPFRRYAGSQRDEMNTEHLQFMLTHVLGLGKNTSLTTTAYLNDFNRNWYKVDNVTVNGERQSIANIIENPVDLQAYYDVISGNSNTTNNDVIAVKANNREYLSTGIQTKLNHRWSTSSSVHDFELGMRYHYDDEDRFQWVDDYGITNGIMELVTNRLAGTDANRISDARAFSTYTLYKLKYKNLTLTPGIRYENIQLGRTDYGSSDPERSGTNISTRENKVDVFIPGIGFNYNFDNVSLFGGIHKGFSPPSNQVGEKPEESVNYELGTRFTYSGLSGELVGFYNDYSNLLGSDLAATGGTGSLDQFNAGEVIVQGIEVLLNYDLSSSNTNISIPITLGYTFTDTEFQNSFGSENDIWGTVSKGDELPYLSKHQLNAAASIEYKKFEVHLNGRFNGAFRTKAGTGSIPANEKVDSNIVLDLGTKFRYNDHITITANAMNLLDERYAVARVPAGLRPGMPFGVFGGLELRY
ncbi:MULTISPECIES: TonB-dependent receptor family protein [Maribacter]|uniref:TonB-dependent receptor n=1 Tax=Maribacter flavus TaxID=1658664 RepID=A0ABU7II66_9FLAO|nr:MULTISPECIES: TonB-dependent receptor [Maribacter]MDC6405110.1 TonB-dependent receptor [Maribacter sp. PR66]MEE1972523.1 TonB-dependent receptor [Maribacter flavus]